MNTGGLFIFLYLLWSLWFKVFIVKLFCNFRFIPRFLLFKDQSTWDCFLDSFLSIFATGIHIVRLLILYSINLMKVFVNFKFPGRWFRVYIYISPANYVLSFFTCILYISCPTSLRIKNWFEWKNWTPLSCSGFLWKCFSFLMLAIGLSYGGDILSSQKAFSASIEMTMISILESIYTLNNRLIMNHVCIHLILV